MTGRLLVLLCGVSFGGILSWGLYVDSGEFMYEVGGGGTASNLLTKSATTLSNSVSFCSTRHSYSAMSASRDRFGDRGGRGGTVPSKVVEGEGEGEEMTSGDKDNPGYLLRSAPSIPSANDRTIDPC
jgi:hypothetical protein